MSTLLGTTPGAVIQASETATQDLLARRQRAADIAQLFPGRTRGIGDFAASPAVRAARAAQEAAASKAQFQADNAARVERLPQAVQRMAYERGLGQEITLLECVAHVWRASERMGGDAVPIYAADVGRALQVDTKRAETLLNEATGKGLLRKTKTLLNGGWFRHSL